ncbi:IgGFc-binding protein-like [Ambystoma mexicanum]|uniref:IgGFc-binding protein-like n=1 Tax=Ambystoma mexicanum TaxID=8296 RepID=UPI0037E8AB28
MVAMKDRHDQSKGGWQADEQLCSKGIVIGSSPSGMRSTIEILLAFPSIQVNTNGVLSFGVAVSQYTSDPFPLSDGRAFVAPFWADVDTRISGNVFYRETNNKALLLQASADIQRYFSIPSFSASWLFIATWDKVAYYKSISTKVVNTFQAVLISDGTMFFILLNYDLIVWTTGMASGGDNLTGLGGTQAQAGFNSGGSTDFFSIPGSRTADIVNVASTSNVQNPGVWAFRVDTFQSAGGCVFNGKFLKAGTTFWNTSICQTKCQCLDSGKINCQRQTCASYEACKPISNYYSCQGIGKQTCTASGDPHYTTFDGRYYSFQGTCTYILAQLCGTNPNLTYFRIEAKNENRGSVQVSFTTLVRVVTYDNEILMSKGLSGRIYLNGIIASLPVSVLGGRLKAYQSGLAVAVSTDFGLTVTFNGLSHATVTLLPNYVNATCGLCGTLNGNPLDDFQTPNGAQATTEALFGKSWKVASNDPFCSDDYVAPTCSSQTQTLYNGTNNCGRMSLPTGAFSSCLPVLSPESFVSSCIYDLCATSGNQTMLCQALEAYSERCQALGITVGQWRQPSFCAVSCPANSQYQSCGTACPSTCSDSTANLFCTLPCREGCICNSNYILSGGDCVPTNMCGCRMNGQYYSLGDVVILTDTCSQKCTCSVASQDMVCVDHGCNSLQECKVVNGVRGCFPGSYGTCSASGDPHYRSFDGLLFEYQGTCKTTLSKYCGAAGNLSDFSIKVVNEHRTSTRVTWTRSVEISVYSHLIVIAAGQNGKVQMNGSLVNLPITLRSGRLQVYRSGSTAKVQTDFGLSVTYDWSQRVVVTVSTAYSGLLCGLCGDFDGNKSDDFRGPNGTLLTSASNFGNSWQEDNTLTYCFDTNSQPPCSPALQSQYRSVSSCGILASSNGPFRDCGILEDSSPYLDNCVYDMCATNGNIQAFCSNLQSYTQQCQSRGLPVLMWRNRTGCDLICPSNSHYEVCGSSCPSSCSSPSSSSNCSTPCAEGCQCNSGYILSGDACVPNNQCGCTYNGQYYKAGETYRQGNNCQTLCRCDGSTGTVQCSSSSCASGEVCTTIQGVYGCYALPDGICRASGDPHYTSFDGQRFDFHGTCKYVLAEFRGAVGVLPFFRVEVKNENWQGLRVAVTTEIFITAYNTLVHLQSGRRGKAEVNATVVNLPVSLSGGRITIYQIGSYSVLKTDFGLRVNYDMVYSVFVTLPTRYWGQVGELTWLPGCSNRCRCNSTASFTCLSSSCAQGHECTVRNGNLGCQSPWAICTVTRDPHYHSFDGAVANFMGTCAYEVSQGSSASSGFSFRVVAENRRYQNPRVSFVYRVTIWLNSTERNVKLVFEQGKIPLMNSVKTSPPTQLGTLGNITMTKSAITVDTPFGVRIFYNGISMLTVQVRPQYQNQLRGMCGNYNGDRKDDKAKPDGMLARNDAEFGNSWRANISSTGCEEDSGVISNTDNCTNLQAIQEQCRIITLPSGPFDECHWYEDADPFFASCVYDLCYYGTNKGMLCTAVASYEAVCQLHSLVIPDWKSQMQCDDDCAENSHYELFGTGCPTTCANLYQNTTCTADSIDGCICDEGYALHAGSCLPVSQCGCTMNGLYYNLGDEAFLTDTCSQKCTCIAQQMVCEAHTCAALEQCKVMNGIRKCYPVDSGICWAFGDLHYHTFDGVSFDYQGTCKYTLSKSSNTGSLTNFSVMVQNEHRLSPVVAWTRTVEVNVYGEQILIASGSFGSVQINGDLSLLPLSLQSGKVQVYFSGSSAVVQTDFGLVVSFDWSHHVSVQVPAAYSGSVSGLCGNFNGNKSDDLRIPDGSLVSSAVTFGNSWREDDDDSDFHCIYTDNPPVCGEDMVAQYSNQSHCGIMKDPAGPFRNGINAGTDVFFKNCVYDMCGTDGDHATLCDIVQGYAHHCQKQGITIQPWRSLIGCGIGQPTTMVGPQDSPNRALCALRMRGEQRAAARACAEQRAQKTRKHPKPKTALGPEDGSAGTASRTGSAETEWTCRNNQQYDLCGSSCPVSCANVTLPSTCQNICKEGCQCKSGFVFSGTECVPPSQCGCTDNGKYYQAGDTFWKKDNCQTLCRCDGATRTIQCSRSSCAAGQTCTTVSGVYGCHVLPDGICRASGDPHYTSFDGRRFDFQGTCKYVLSEFRGVNSTLPDFRVEVTNEHWQGMRVAVTKEVFISVYQTQIYLQSGRRGTVQINGVIQTLPVNLGPHGGSVVIFMNGAYTVLKTDFGLTVNYDMSYSVFITLPAVYKGLPGGLCGNFNGMISDDFTTPSGSVVNNAFTFGTSWMSTGSTGCDHGCSDNCPVCSAEKLMPSKSACWIIQNPRGPFSSCHTKVDPAHYFSDCVYDHCLTEGNSTVLCQAIQTYAATCQAANVTIASWRNNSFCAPVCPGNSHYELCHRRCQDSCISSSLSPYCGATCSEGCFCNDGYLRSGDTCVKPEQCGCQHDGRYYNVGDLVWLPGCSQRCRCDSTGNFSCISTSCAQGHECALKNGKLGCQSPWTICTVTGDPHYHTFDGAVANFMGTCAYEVSQGSSPSSGFSFRVVAENKRYQNPRVSFVYRVTIWLNSTDRNVKMVFEQGKVPLINGIKTTLPARLGLLANVTALKSAISVDTPFGVRIQYSGGSTVTVQVGPQYQKQLRGMCGNYNGVRGDDKRKPDGTIARSDAEFGNSWKADISSAGCVADSGESNTTDTCTNLGAIQGLCRIITRPSGPFDECHWYEDADPFFASCVYDLCYYGTNKGMLCTAVASYEAVCQLHSLVIPDWRPELQCGDNCPENSHYELFGTGCPGTCANLHQNATCTTENADGCFCDEGYALQAGSCVPVSQCGCTMNGVYYNLGDEAFLTDTCSQKCTCIAQQMVCEAHTCATLEECKVLNGIRKCYPVDSGICWASGDLHYHTFDGVSFDYQGTCKYTLSKTSSTSESLISFRVMVQNEHRWSPAVARTRLVEVDVYGEQISIESGDYGRVQINGSQFLLPISLQSGKLHVYYSGSSAVVKADFGLIVSFDWSYHVSVQVPAAYSGSLDGLCGNFNGNKSDDLRIPDGSLVSNAVTFGNSWREDNDDSDFHCVDTDNPPVCGESVVAQYSTQNQCGIMKDPAGPFRDCTNTDTESYFKDCVFDMCATDSDRHTLCKSLENYAHQCQKRGISIRPWRNHTGTECEITCSSNQEYELCGTSCPGTCSKIPATCQTPCMEGCQCKSGFILSGTDCVTQSQCGCTANGTYYRSGDTFWKRDNCHTLCRCDGISGAVQCSSSSCSSSETCTSVNGVYGCHVLPDGICRGSGDPHYASFDGRRFDFQGTCKYILSEFSGVDEALPSFRIEVKNENLQSLRVAVTAEVFVSVYQTQINGISQTLPVNLGNGKIVIYKSGAYTVLKMDFGLTVNYDMVYSVFITLPARYRGRTGGLCGNFNGKTSDDFTTPSGSLVNNAFTFGTSWMSTGSTGCDHGCSDNCPICSAEKLMPSKSACWIIQNPRGPFSSCHAKVDPAHYFSDCVYDHCLTEGNNTVLCQAIQTYAATCQAANVTIASWRTNSFCGIQCPENSHYELCGQQCLDSCSATSLLPHCGATCSEGCVCDAGYIRSGDACVQVEQCGCQHDGLYYEVGDLVWLSGCTQRCRCDLPGSFRCQSSSCPHGQQCAIKNEKLGCQTDWALCMVSGDTHYYTYDGALADFQGTCAYEISQTSGAISGFSFRVVANNQHRGGSQVSFVYRVDIWLESTDARAHIILEEGKQVLVNGAVTGLPVQLGSMATVSRLATMISVDTAFSVSIQYDGRSTLVVRVGPQYQKQLQGMCGNYNSDWRDDKVMPSGIIAHNDAEYGNSWKANITVEGCQDDGGVDQSCPDLLVMEELCRIISDPLGPFAECHWYTDPLAHYSSCVYDLCTHGYTKDMLCIAVNSYALMCTAHGVPLPDWRTEMQCVSDTTTTKATSMTSSVTTSTTKAIFMTTPLVTSEPSVTPLVATTTEETSMTTPIFTTTAIATSSTTASSSSVADTTVKEATTTEETLRTLLITTTTTEETSMTTPIVTNTTPMTSLMASPTDKTSPNIFTGTSKETSTTSLIESSNETTSVAIPHLITTKKSSSGTTTTASITHTTFVTSQRVTTTTQSTHEATTEATSITMVTEHVTSSADITATARNSEIAPTSTAKPTRLSPTPISTNTVTTPSFNLVTTTDGICQASGDLHYTSFDGKRFDFQGTCKYIFSETPGVSGAMSFFRVEVKNAKWRNLPVAVTSEVVISVNETQIQLQSGLLGAIKVNGVNMNLPVRLQQGRVVVYRKGPYAVVKTDFGLTVNYDMVSSLFIALPARYQGQTRGLCGNFNRVASDDFTTRDGEVVDSAFLFGSSWVSDGSTSCDHGCSDNCPVVKMNETVRNNSSCKIIQDPNGPFSACHPHVDPSAHFLDCVYDVGLAGGKEEVLCHAVQTYVAVCQSLGVTLRSWRNSTFCAIQCPTNSHYELCSGEKCQDSCAASWVQPECAPACSEGCFCDPGYLRSGDTCVKSDECGCEHEGQYYKVGERAWLDGCTQKCICSSPGNFQCGSTKCSADQQCALKNGRLGCQNNLSICTVTGDPHYFTFDGAVTTFQGACTYEISKTSSWSSDFSFRVIAENRHRGNRHVSFVSRVDIWLTQNGFSTHIIVGQNRHVQVDGVITHVPAIVGSLATISYEGRSILVKSMKNMEVQYDGVSTLLIRAGPEYKNQLTGMCGNLNGSPDDDKVIPDGTKASNDQEFGNTWKSDSSSPGLVYDREVGDKPIQDSARETHHADEEVYEDAVYDSVKCSSEVNKYKEAFAVLIHDLECIIHHLVGGSFDATLGAEPRLVVIQDVYLIGSGEMTSCDILACSDNEWCGEDKGEYACTRYESPDHLDLYDYELICQGSKSYLSFSATMLRASGIPAENLHLADPSCVGTQVDDRLLFNFVSSSHSCGSQLQVNKTHIIYSNVVEGHYVQIENNLIMEDKTFHIEFSCAYPLSINLSFLEAIHVVPSPMFDCEFHLASFWKCALNSLNAETL